MVSVDMRKRIIVLCSLLIVCILGFIIWFSYSNESQKQQTRNDETTSIEQNLIEKIGISADHNTLTSGITTEKISVQIDNTDAAQLETFKSQMEQNKKCIITVPYNTTNNEKNYITLWYDPKSTAQKNSFQSSDGSTHIVYPQRIGQVRVWILSHQKWIMKDRKAMADFDISQSAGKETLTLYVIAPETAADGPQTLSFTYPTDNNK